MRIEKNECGKFEVFDGRHMIARLNSKAEAENAVRISLLEKENRSLEEKRVLQLKDMAAKGECCVYMTDCTEDPITVTVYGVQTKEQRRDVLNTICALDVRLCAENKRDS